MFNADDFKDINKDENSIPDGVMDATEFYEDLVFLSKQLEETDYESLEDKMQVMMRIINYYHNSDINNSIEIDPDRVNGITIGLLFHIANIFSGMENEAKKEYWEYVNTQLLPTMQEDKTILPYWDTDE